MTGISAQYVDGLELRIKELTAYAKKLEQQIADDASVNAEIDKRLQSRNDVVAALISNKTLVGAKKMRYVPPLSMSGALKTLNRNSPL